MPDRRVYERAVELGLCPVPVTPETKRPVVKWSHLQKQAPSQQEIDHWADALKDSWIGFVCGEASGNLEVLDFDIPHKGDPGAATIPPAYQPWRDLLAENGHEELSNRLSLVVKTVSGGRHVYYRRIGGAKGNTKLAADAEGQVLIETRGQGGFVVAPPSDGYLRLDGQFAAIPELTDEEAEVVWTAARALDQTEPEEDPVYQTERAALNGSGSPLDDFNARGSWAEAFDWQRTGKTWEGKDEYKRPGTKNEKSGVVGQFSVGERFMPFTQTIPRGMREKRVYTKASVFAHFHHNGDFKAAARDLLSRGYGEPRKRAGTSPAPAFMDEAFPPEIPLTELGNVERLLANHGQDVRYCHPFNAWLLWQKGRWEIDESGGATVFQWAQEVARQIAQEAAACDDPERRKRLLGWALKSESGPSLKHVVDLAKMQPGVAITPKDLDQDSRLLNFSNGTLDLETFQLRPHKREDLLTKGLDVPYDEHAECPMWLDFLDTVLQGDAETMRYVWHACGYSLTGEVGEKCFFFLHGFEGNNGKSVFVDTLMNALGPYAMRTPTETLLAKKYEGGVPNDVARLRGARFVAAAELGDGKHLNEELVKELTGNDVISARFMRGEWFDFKPAFKLWMTGNHKPLIMGQDNAIWNRVKLIPFTFSVPKERQDVRLTEKLKAELPGILAWMVEGCKAWRLQGRLEDPKCVQEAVQSYRKEMDVLGEFLLMACERVEAVETNAMKLYIAYKKWAEANGHKAMTNTSFGRRMVERGFSKRKGRQAYYYVGIRVIDEETLDHVYRGGD